MAKLYSHVSRLLVRRQIPRYTESRLKWALTLKPGDLINDCSSFNVRIKYSDPDYIKTGNGWYIYDFTFTLESGGSCSLIHCGVEAAPSRDKVESDWIKWAEGYINSGYLEQWCGKSKALFNKQLAALNKRIDILKSGGHITDEDGCLLEEFNN
jgi:hypothetical protein